MKNLAAFAAAVLLAAPLPVLAHGAPNWKAVAWQRTKNTPEGLRSGFFVDVNSITRAGDIVSFKEEWQFMDDQNRPVTKRGVQPPDYLNVWDPIPLNELTGSLRVGNCKTKEYLHGSGVRGADGKFKVKALTTWAPVPAGKFRVVYDFVCRQR